MRALFYLSRYPRRSVAGPASSVSSRWGGAKGASLPYGSASLMVFSSAWLTRSATLAGWALPIADNNDYAGQKQAKSSTISTIFETLAAVSLQRSFSPKNLGEYQITDHCGTRLSKHEIENRCGTMLFTVKKILSTR